MLEEIEAILNSNQGDPTVLLAVADRLEEAGRDGWPWRLIWKRKKVPFRYAPRYEWLYDGLDQRGRGQSYLSHQLFQVVVSLCHVYGGATPLHWVVNFPSPGMAYLCLAAAIKEKNELGRTARPGKG